MPCGCAGLLCINKLLNLRPFLVDFGQVFRTKFLIDLEFLLRAVLLPDVNIVGPQTVMRVGNIRVQFQRALILWN